MVSIIIPCYNVANFLPKTLESVLKQTDPDWEIIAVDDGSTDNTAEVLKKYTQSDNRIKLFSKSNGGVSSARNFGIEHAKGEWIYFLDGDDFIEKNLVEIINNQNKEIEVTVFEFVKESPHNKRYYQLRKKESLFKDFFTNKQTIHISSFCTKLDLIIKNRIRFDEQTYYGEDREFIANILVLKPKFIIINEVLFHYQVRLGSATLTHAYNEKRLTSIFSGERTFKRLKNTPLEKVAYTNFVFSIPRHIKMFYDYNTDAADIKKILFRYKDKYLKGFHFYGWSRLELYTTLAGILSYNKHIFRLFLKLV